MIASDTLQQIGQLRAAYEYDCAVLRRALADHPGLLAARLAIRGERYDEEVRAVMQHETSEAQHETH